MRSLKPFWHQAFSRCRPNVYSTWATWIGKINFFVLCCRSAEFETGGYATVSEMTRWRKVTFKGSWNGQITTSVCLSCTVCNSLSIQVHPSYVFLSHLCTLKQPGTEFTSLQVWWTLCPEKCNFFLLWNLINKFITLNREYLKWR